MDEQALKKILSRDNAPEIDVNARKRAVNLAVAEFKAVQSEKSEKSSQGVSILSRLMGMSNISKGRETMESKQKRKLFYGGMATAMGVVLIAALSTGQLNEALQRFVTPAGKGSAVALNSPQATEITTLPGVNATTNESYVAAIEKQNEENLERALQNGESSIPVPIEAPQDRMQMQESASEEPLSRWRKLQEERVERRYQAGERDDKDAGAVIGTADSADPNAVVGVPQMPAEEDVFGFAEDEKRDYVLGTAAPEKKQEARQKNELAKTKEAVQPSVTGGLVGADKVGRRESESVMIMPYPMPPADVIHPTYHDEGRDKFAEFKPSPFQQVAAEPVSTFSSDVDTASYSFVRRQLNNGMWPQPDAVRIEEMVNYFDYNYPLPESQAEPFAPSVTVMDSPWAKGKKLMHVGIKGYEISEASKPHANIVFLLDVSGSMNEPNKLPLVKSSMKMLLDNLNPNDTVAITVYAGAAGTVLEPTKASERYKILSAIDNLNAGGSTAGEAGIRLAYQLAEQNFDREGVNRIILATDGDFNVGTSSTDELKQLVEQKRESGIFLSVLGFGQGNYNDAIMQTLAQNGNGVAAYIDTLNEARKVLVEEASSSLFTIAKDVKFQIEFNPAEVAEYRLVGYETRALNREDFNNDRIDAGDIGAGHTVTAIYEFVPVGSEALSVDPLRYAEKEAAQKPAAEPAPSNGEYAFLKMRYKLPNESTSKLITRPVTVSDQKTPDGDVAFSVAVAAFGQMLKNDGNIRTMTLDDVIALAQQGKGEDPFGYRAEFINLVRLAKSNVR